MAGRAKGAGSITQLANGKWRGSFEAGYTPAGGRRRVSVTANTKRSCENKLREKIREHQAGVGSSARRELDVKQWLDIWLHDRERTVRPKTFRMEAGMMRNHVVPVIGKAKLRELSTDHIRAVRAAMEKAGGSPTTIRHCQRIFQQALKAAVSEGRRVPEGVLVMEKPPAGSNTRSAIPIEEAKKLVAEAWKSPEGSRWLAALLQGMRQGEALGLTWDHIDFESNLITIEWQLQEIGYKDKVARTGFQIPSDLKVERLEGNFHLTPPKSKAGVRVQPVVGPMREALLAWREVAPVSPHGLVWPNASGGPLRSNKDRANWKALQDKAGVHKPDGSYFVIHEARNTTASLLLAAGVDPFIITQILGHTSITTSQGYMRVAESQKRQAIEQVAGLLGLE